MGGCCLIHKHRAPGVAAARGCTYDARVPNVTIRVDDELKRNLEAAAAADQRSLTDFLLHAAKRRMASQCPACGRSDTPGAVPPGLTSAFDGFLEDVRKKENQWIPILLTTSEGTAGRAYYGILKPDDDHRYGMVTLTFQVPVRAHFGAGTLHLECIIPRGVVTGWRYDQQGTVRRKLIDNGYEDGNGVVLRANAAAV